MNANAHDLEDLMRRLHRADVETKRAIREEVQAWPYEEIMQTLRVYWPQEYGRATHSSPRLAERVRRYFAPAEPPRPKSVLLDILIQIIAETTTDVRLIGPVLSSLARYEELKNRQRADKQPHWSYRSSDSFVRGLVDITTGFYVDMQRPLLAALRRLLPRLSLGDRILSAAQIDALLIPLRYPYRDVELTLDILIALAWLGGESSLAMVAQVQDTSIDTNNGRIIRAAAQSCRAQIEMRTDKKRQAQTLLRAAASPAPSDAHTLLRSVREAAPDPAPEQLLRPTE